MLRLRRRMRAQKTPGGHVRVASGASRHRPKNFSTTARTLILLLTTAVFLACGTDAPVERAASPAPRLPSFLGATLTSSLVHAPELDEASALLCARDTDNVVDHDVRRATGLADGMVGALLVREETAERSKRVLAERARVLVEELGATHAGVATGSTPDGAPCAAITVVKRILTLKSVLPRRLDAPEPFAWRATGDAEVAAVYLLRPSGFVEKRALVIENGQVSDVITPGAAPGRHVLEVIVDRGNDDPEVALYWPFVVGTPTVYPMPAVLFPDEGHDDHALTLRLESMVLRLRNEQEIDTLMLSPSLSAVAQARAQVIAHDGALGHRRPEGRSVGDDLLKRGDTDFARVAEVQAQGATLREAWGALLESPAHRHALLDTGMSTMGGAVARSNDGLGRPLISVVIVVARRMSTRAIPELKTEMLGRMNLARHARSAPLLKRDPDLEAIADAHARAMARAGVVDERVDDEKPVSVIALHALAYQEVVAVLAALDDPLRLLPSRAMLQRSFDRVGIGISGGGPNGRFMLCVLVGAAP
jgi:uncharacterized protein YkwD